MRQIGCEKMRARRAVTTKVPRMYYKMQYLTGLLKKEEIAIRSVLHDLESMYNMALRNGRLDFDTGVGMRICLYDRGTSL
jgi:hypothetical protein